MKKTEEQLEVCFAKKLNTFREKDNKEIERQRQALMNNEFEFELEEEYVKRKETQKESL